MDRPQAPLPKPHPDVVFTEMHDGSGVLLHLGTKFYFTLNGTGVFAWKALQEGTSPSLPELAKAMAEIYEVDETAATQDLTHLLDELQAEGLLTSPGPNAARPPSR